MSPAEFILPVDWQLSPVKSPLGVSLAESPSGLGPVKVVPGGIYSLSSSDAFPSMSEKLVLFPRRAYSSDRVSPQSWRIHQFVCSAEQFSCSPAGVFHHFCILHVVIIAFSNCVAFPFNMEHYAMENSNICIHVLNLTRPYPRQRWIVVQHLYGTFATVAPDSSQE